MADPKTEELVKIVRAFCDWVDASSSHTYGEVDETVRPLIKPLQYVLVHLDHGYLHMTEYHGRKTVWELRKAAAKIMGEPIPPEPDEC